MVAKSVVAPVDRIKILFQVSSEPFSLRRVLKIMQRIHSEEGLSGLWKGNSATMLRCGRAVVGSTATGGWVCVPS
jgi:hypothetical protein